MDLKFVKSGFSLAKYKRAGLPNHYYNHVDFTTCPMYLSLSIYCMLLYVVLTANYLDYYLDYLYYSFIFVFIYAQSWVHDLTTESMKMGQYTKKVYGTLLTGFCLFVLTEFLIFFGFFWALFDRFFNISSSGYTNYTYFENYSEKIGITKPVQGLCCLYFSGSFCNLAHYVYFYNKNLMLANAYLYLSGALGVLFLYIQYEEFNHLLFHINDQVINSSFYLLAGFHGFHVTVGLIFLIIQHYRINQWHVTRSRHIGFTLAMIYWHFVDIVWFFLFYVFYIMIFTKVGSGHSNFLRV